MKNHFLYFTKAERLGIISLLMICLALWVVPAVLPDWPEHNQARTAPLPALNPVARATAFVDSLNQKQPSQDTRPFDPNLATEAQLKTMGIHKQAIRAWLSYLHKGGRFEDWSDMEQFRALNDADRNKIRPFVRFDQAVAAIPQETSRSKPLTDFNPHEQTQRSLLNMGLSQRVARNWENYLQAGGRFQQAEDIQKIYGLSTEDYQRLLPFVNITTPHEEWANAEAVPEVALPSSYDKAEYQFTININEATAEEWQRLRGIGPTYSRRIVKFRDKLGGFHSVEQVKETYGLPDSVFQVIVLQLRSSTPVKKLPINLASIQELAAHPYLHYDEARMIVRYREEHGAYHNTTDLKQLYGLDPKILSQMEPYWNFTQ